MTTRQWYSVLLEDQLLMPPSEERTPGTLLPVRSETKHPMADWPQIWRLARTKGLGSDLTSFLFRLLHCLLPTQERVSRIVVTENQNSGLCQHCDLEVENLPHAFFNCEQSRIAGHALLGHVQLLVPGLSPDDALRLELGADLSDEEELATTCLLATGLKYIWEARASKKQVTTFRMRAEVEARISILRRTRHKNAGELMGVMLSS